MPSKGKKSTLNKMNIVREIYEDFSFPEENQMILRVVKSEGNNLHQVTTTTGEEFQVSMPPKFRNHIWIKQGDYVIAESIPHGDKIKGVIKRILYDEQIKHFKENNIWPEAFSEKRKEDNGYQMDEDLLPRCSDSDDDSETDKILRYNPNKYLPEEDCSDSSSDSDESDEHGKGDESNSDESDEDEDSDESNDDLGSNCENSDDADENDDEADENKHNQSGDHNSEELSSKKGSDE